MLMLSHVSKTFRQGSGEEHRVLDDISLHVKKGEFVSLIGANGAGKSTLLNAIAGEFLTEEGTILLDGKDITLLPEHKRARQIGHLFQDPMRGTAPGMTVEENLALAAGRGGWFSHVSREDKVLFREKLKELDIGLEDRMQKPVGLLSGGQRQALTLMMATICPPKVLLLDEHTAALDPATAEKVLALTEKIVREQELTCIMITHNMESALAVGDRTLMMDRGHILLDVAGEERKGLTVGDLLQKFRQLSGHSLATDRILLQGGNGQ